MIISAVEYDLIPNVFPKVLGYITKAAEIAGGRFDAASIFRGLMEKEYSLWVVVDEESDEFVAAMTTRITDYPTGRGMAIDWIGGKRMSEWLDEFSSVMDQYAKDNGCKFIEGMGRHGWIRELKKYGYYDIPCFRKDLTDGEGQ